MAVVVNELEVVDAPREAAPPAPAPVPPGPTPEELVERAVRRRSERALRLHAS